MSATREVTVGAALADARAAGLPRLDAQLILAYVMGRERSWVLAHEECPLEPLAVGAWHRLVLARLGGEPLAYLLGEKEFYGLRLQIDSRVLVPRPETELLVDWTLEVSSGLMSAGLHRPTIVDLGTGSGAIALAVKNALAVAELSGSDASEPALSVAQANARRLGLALELRGGHWWRPWAGRRFHVAVSNPPYVAEGDPHLSALCHEPAAALRSGPEGLDALIELIGGAMEHLEPGGWLLLEHGFEQATAVLGLLDSAGFQLCESRTDLSGHPRCSGGRRPF